ncbi:hypothetical protein ACRE_091140 [Hapsidospora chrysogenum ATCC 11550]|uniref:Uncharacterized protein n=1 Tax=Hapsidospora chrysogenum (strain ATCC 11550 / CBS 779.69 / DSM 880 / IAM 14645 / JCM 23072 / IMI 49137) TaxID=857340 RepID=A0A086SSZ4_HAPC1|nr:hypothetical protein ACRE_091140 [Hapsidospora chrysogenum ATCC 11550]
MQVPDPEWAGIDSGVWIGKHSSALTRLCEPLISPHTAREENMRGQVFTTAPTAAHMRGTNGRVSVNWNASSRSVANGV